MQAMEFKVRSKTTLKDGSAVSDDGKLIVSEMVNDGTHDTPLKLLSLSLASCETIMFNMIAEKIGVKPKKLEVDVEMEFQVGYGLRRAIVTYKVDGLDETTANRIVEMVKRNCPVYRTLARTGAIIEDKIVTT
ncbi:MAG: OsmC family protein [Desulfurococcales archaeon]|nr:OsmC family protein [Desulfurococcales archaeon]MCE4629016.1 OsmC family protein [Desulfurococcales archaeon]